MTSSTSDAVNTVNENVAVVAAVPAPASVTNAVADTVSVVEQPRIDALFEQHRPLLSFEFFPPKDGAGSELLFRAIDELKPLHPDFVSITRTGVGTQPTLDLTHRVQNELGIRAMAHLTCVHHTPDEMGDALDCLWERGVRNVLALRGDLPPGQAAPQAGDSGFRYATDLVPFVRQRHDFCVGVAGYPEGHPQCLNVTRDIEYLNQKVDAGASFVITQLFFDNADFYRWRDAVQAMGVTVPIVAGIMPILSVAQTKRFVGMCGAKIPHPLLLKLESLESDPLSVHAAGVEHAISQCEELLANGVSGLHFYTLNRSKATVLITQELKLERQ
ncbi:MAG: methylenetetrahydrofolate reductase [Abditibacteriota bacterium]|nr:methylenetetrahydrofolate reductase [Abditibacteriota bacterium]